MYINLLILFFFLFTDTGKTPIEWVNSVLNNPNQYFRNSYEKNIFTNLQTKYPNLSVEKAIYDDTKIIGTFKLNSHSYLLVFEIDNSSKIRYIYRSPGTLNVTNLQTIDPDIQIWLGKFFYRLDAGDSSVLNDMLFFDDVQVRYKQIKNKSKIVKILLNDFSNIATPSSIESYLDQDDNYFFNVNFNLIGQLIIKVPPKLVHPPDTDFLQEDFFQEIEKKMFESSHTNNPGLKNKDIVLDIVKKFYKNARLFDNRIVVPYQTQRFDELKSLTYKIIRKEGYFTVEPDISLEQGNNQTFLFNKVINIPYYINNTMEEPIESAIKTLNFGYMLTFGKSFWPEDNIYDIKGTMRYRGFKIHDVSLRTTNDILSLLNIFHNKGSLYYYPSSFKFDKNTIIQKGILFLISNNKMDSDYYHFAEIYIHFKNTDDPIPYFIEIVFYPYIRNS